MCVLWIHNLCKLLVFQPEIRVKTYSEPLIVKSSVVLIRFIILVFVIVLVFLYKMLFVGLKIESVK